MLTSTDQVHHIYRKENATPRTLPGQCAREQTLRTGRCREGRGDISRCHVCPACVCNKGLAVTSEREAGREGCSGKSDGALPGRRHSTVPPCSTSPFLNAETGSGSTSMRLVLCQNQAKDLAVPSPVCSISLKGKLLRTQGPTTPQ